MKLFLQYPTEILQEDQLGWTFFANKKKSLRNGNYSLYLLSKCRHLFSELLERPKYLIEQFDSQQFTTETSNVNKR